MAGLSSIEADPSYKSRLMLWVAIHIHQAPNVISKGRLQRFDVLFSEVAAVIEVLERSSIDSNRRSFFEADPSYNMHRSFSTRLISQESCFVVFSFSFRLF